YVTAFEVPDINTLSLHDALPILGHVGGGGDHLPYGRVGEGVLQGRVHHGGLGGDRHGQGVVGDFALDQLVAAVVGVDGRGHVLRSEEHTSELQSRENLVCRLLLE